MANLRACVYVILLIGGAVNGRCPSASYLRRVGGWNLCARMYQHSHIHCGGDYLDARAGSRTPALGHGWNDRISSLVVLPGCELQVCVCVCVRACVRVCVCVCVCNLIITTETLFCLLVVYNGK